ncbi:MAG: hypothetical protein ACRDSP_19435 [Pseudonocardiaceae bacterium]
MSERSVRRGRPAPVRRPEGFREQPEDLVVAPSVRHGLVTPAHLTVLQRTVGNRALTAAIAGARPGAGDGLVVQRLAFVAGTRVPADDPTLNPAMQAFAADPLVRNYTDRAEFQAHAAGTTNYLGNLPGPSAGTWVRFSPTGTNLLGENHTQVTLEHVVGAVGTTSFVYEPFSVDVMPAGSQMRTAYETENAQRFQAFGVAHVADKQQFGGESLFPKMGYGLNLLLPYLAGAGNLDPIKSGGYTGQPVQRYLKIAWGHTKDVAAQLAGRRFPWPRPSRELRALVREYQASRAVLDGFITGLPVDGYLGDALDTPVGLPLVPALRTFCEAFVAVMLARTTSDTGLTRRERRRLGRMPRAGHDEKEAVFEDWRNLHFAHATAAAAQRGVRYVGMGRLHLDYLRAQGLPPNSHPYDMTGNVLARFETETRRLAARARVPAP